MFGDPSDERASGAAAACGRNLFFRVPVATVISIHRMASLCPNRRLLSLRPDPSNVVHQCAGAGSAVSAVPLRLGHEAACEDCAVDTGGSPGES